jgi:hypothetical protein
MRDLVIAEVEHLLSVGGRGHRARARRHAATLDEVLSDAQASRHQSSNPTSKAAHVRGAHGLG